MELILNLQVENLASKFGLMLPQTERLKNIFCQLMLTGRQEFKSFVLGRE